MAGSVRGSEAAFRGAKPTRGLLARLAPLFVFVGLGLNVAPEVLAVVGRPATPASVAGVARRSVRRNTP
jgi:hypothetical protein